MADGLSSPKGAASHPRSPSGLSPDPGRSPADTTRPGMFSPAMVCYAITASGIAVSAALFIGGQLDTHSGALVIPLQFGVAVVLLAVAARVADPVVGWFIRHPQSTLRSSRQMAGPPPMQQPVQNIEQRACRGQ